MGVGGRGVDGAARQGLRPAESSVGSPSGVVMQRVVSCRAGAACADRQLCMLAYVVSAMTTAEGIRLALSPPPLDWAPGRQLGRLHTVRQKRRPLSSRG